LNEKLEN